MTKTLTQIQKQIDVLQRKAEAIKQKEVGEVVARIKEAIRHYGITAADLGLGKGGAKKLQPAQKSRTRKSAGKAKFRDATGRTWTGRGRRPQWYLDALAAGKKPEDMMVQ